MEIQIVAAAVAARLAVLLFSRLLKMSLSHVHHYYTILLLRIYTWLPPIIIKRETNEDAFYDPHAMGVSILAPNFSNFVGMQRVLNLESLHFDYYVPVYYVKSGCDCRFRIADFQSYGSPDELAVL